MTLVFHKNWQLFKICQALGTIPDVVQGNSSLSQLQKNLEVSFSSDGKGIQKEITAALKADSLNANQSL